MAPFASLNRNVAQVVWYTGSIGLLVVFVRWSIDALPDRRRSRQWLVWLTILFVGKFYVREVNLGQTNGLLGVALVGALMAIQRGQAVHAGALVGLGAFVKPYALVLLPWLLVASGVKAATRLPRRDWRRTDPPGRRLRVDREPAADLPAGIAR